MGRPRTSIEELELTGSGNVRRSLSYKAKAGLLRRVDLETILDELLERRTELLADIKQRGLVFQEDRFQNNKLYRATIQHPGLKVLLAVERQILAYARVLKADDVNASSPGRKSDEELLALVRGSN